MEIVMRRNRTGSALAALCAAALTCSPAHSADGAAARALASRLAALAQQTQRLADTNAIAKLQRAYGYYLDKGFWDEAADLFADDATFESGMDGVYVGKARIRARLVAEGGGHPGPGLPYGQMNHRMQLQPVIDVADDGHTASARWREIALLGQYHERAEWGTGIYENEYVKQDGIWKIARLNYYPNFVVPYAEGWARAAATSGSWISPAGRALPADRPASRSYQPFPTLFTPPFHYAAQSGEPVWRAGAASRALAEPVDAVLARAVHDLEILSSRQAIENLQGRFGYYTDKGLWDEASKLFSESATYEYGQQGVYVGRRHVRQALGLQGPLHLADGQLNDYPMLQPIIDVAPDNRTAKARWRSDVMLASQGRAQWGGGVYENEYVNEDGHWRISKLHYYVTFLADYDQGWTKGAVPMSGPSTALPPDRPPSVAYASLPSVNVVPYHYANPVSGAEPSIEQSVPLDAMPAELRELTARANALAHQVELLKDQAQIERLQRAYGYYVDKAQWPEIAALFAKDGTYEIGGRGVFIGPRRVLEYLVTGLGPIGMSTREGQILDHQQFQGIVDVAPDGRTAKGRWTALVMGGSKGGDALWGDATYENTYIKLDGVWHAASFRAPFNMYASYKGGWKDSSVANTRPDSFAPPPDLPPSTIYLTYPSFYVAPYHYPNPVTGRPAPPPDPAAGGTAPMHGHRDLPQ
jgi:hypothetical protein